MGGGMEYTTISGVGGSAAYLSRTRIFVARPGARYEIFCGIRFGN
jgi:hypothetical protein